MPKRTMLFAMILVVSACGKGSSKPASVFTLDDDEPHVVAESLSTPRAEHELTQVDTAPLITTG